MGTYTDETVVFMPRGGMPRTFKITFVECQDGGWKASIYAVPGCHAEGETKEEARESVLAAFWEIHGDEKAEFIEEVRR